MSRGYSQSHYRSGYQPDPTCQAVVTPRMLRLTNETRWWVLLLAILGVLATLLGLAGAMINLVAGVGLGVAVGALAGAIQAGIALLFYAVPSGLLIWYSLAAGRFVMSGHAFDLVAATRVQRNFWFTMGLLALLSLIGSALMVVGAAAVLSQATAPQMEPADENGALPNRSRSP